MPITRQLAAIMFADIVGYTAIMQENEELAVHSQQKLKQKLEEEIEKHEGRILDFRGDGAMCSFSSTTEAVRAALALQLNMLSTPVVPLRIGIHTGDIVFEGNNIYGDGVNIASRMESFAVPGSIFISGKAHDDIKNQNDIQTVSLGKFALKNVKEQVEIFAVSNTGIKIPARSDLEGKGDVVPEKSIAVLPFVNMSNDPEQEYFSDGMAEEIINALAHLKDLKVAGRTSSFQFKDLQVDLRKVGEKLKVSTVLEGSIRKHGNKLRVTAQLTNVSDGFNIWSEKYDRTIENVFAIQDEIATAITEKLRITLLATEKPVTRKAPTIHKDAYDNYLRGRFFWNKRGLGLKKGLEYFLKAAEIDPLFALAHAGIADSYSLLAFYALMPPHDAMPKAKKAAETAIQLNDQLVEAWTSLAFINMLYDWDWEAARNHFKKAFAINSNYAPTHNWHSTFLSWIENKPDEAVNAGKKARELEPLVGISYNLLANTLIGARRFEEALKASKSALELEPNSFLAYWFLGVSLICLERYPEAIDALTHSVTLSGRHSWTISELSNAYALIGDSQKAQVLLDELITRSGQEYVSALFIFIPAFALNHYEMAFDYLDKAYEQRDGTIPGCRAWPGFEPAKQDSRFQDLIKRMNFPI